jgi:coenzyme PQQ precursor peptide PqqA
MGASMQPPREPQMMDLPTLRRFDMIWETPRAIELRFGMEITMYVANR